MIFLAELLSFLIKTYIFVIILHIGISWLIVFKVIDVNNPQARNLIALLQKATDPVMKPVQRYIPPIGGIDLTPVVVIIGLQILNSMVWKILV
ncbi:MAG: YggT family protein [Alphaproteobacteria bacterium]|nr:YggT family protein [Alphaproteobacteria bacterium]